MVGMKDGGNEVRDRGPRARSLSPLKAMVTILLFILREVRAAWRA